MTTPDITVPALGRPFHVGALYSSYTDTVFTFGQMNPENVEKISRSDETMSTKMKILSSKMPKSEILCLRNGDNLSILVNLIPLTGSAKIFNDALEFNDPNTASIIVKFEHRSGSKHCDIDELKKLLDVAHISKQATHVATQVEYGWDAFFVFEKKVEGGTSLKQTLNKLELFASKLVHSSVESNIAFDDDFCDGISCKFYRDSDLGSDNPSCFSEAIETINILLSKPPLSIPKVATLYPLNNLGASVIIVDIEPSVVDRVERLCTDFKSVKAEMELLEVLDIFDWAKDELNLFEHLLQTVSVQFSNLLRNWVPEIRESLKTIPDFTNLIQNYEDSCFSPTNLRMCLKTIRTTSFFLEKLLKVAKNKSVGILVDNQLAKLQNDKKVIVFAFKSSVLATKKLQELKNHVFQNTFAKPIESREWNENPEILEQTKKTFLNFLEYKDFNQSSSVKFVVLDDESDDIVGSPTAVCVYGKGLKSVIELPSNAPAPISTGAKGVDWIELTLEPPSFGRNSCLEYLLTILEYGRRGKKRQDAFDLASVVKVKCLLPGKKYIFQTQIRSEAGLSPPSDWSESIETEKESTLAKKILEESVKVADANSQMNIYTPKSKDVEFVCDGLRKVQVGGPGQYHYNEKSIMVLGATGSGKTTFLNSMSNYLVNVHEDDPFRFKIVTEDEEGEASSQSKTKMVSAYCFNNTKLPYRLVVIDTPGFGDTEGLAADKRTTGLIKNLFENKDGNGVDRLDAVCVVVKASDSKLDAQQRHNFNSVFQLFGKDIIKNIFIVATYCDASDPPVIASLRDANIDYSKFFKFNNSAFFEGVKTTQLERTSQQLYWKTGMESFNKLFDALEKTSSVSLALSFEVLVRRHQLETLVMDLHRSVNLGLSNLERMRQEIQVMKKHEAKIKANKSFTYTVQHEKVVQVDISGQGIHTTNCLTCNFTCHSNCRLAKNADKAKCIAMSPTGDCKVCPRNCHWDLHRNTPFINRTIMEPVTRTDEDLRKKYLKATDDMKNTEVMFANLGEMFGQQQKDILKTVTKIRENIQELQKIAHRPTYMTDVEYIETLIASEKSEHRPGWAVRAMLLEEQKSLALMIEQAQDPDYNPFKKYEEEGWFNYAKTVLKKFCARIFPKMF